MPNTPAPKAESSDLPVSDAPAQTPSSQPAKTPSGKGNPLKVVIPLVLVAALGVGAYFLASVLNVPAKVKEKATVTHPMYESLRRNTQKTAEHLDREPKADADSFDRYSEEGENLLNDTKKDRELLAASVESIKVAEMKPYADHLTEFMKKADELVALEEENVALGSSVSRYIKDYQKQATTIASATNYVYSDPDKFLKTMGAVITELDRLIGELKKVELKSELKDAFEGFITMQTMELDYLKEMKTAVDSRSSVKLTAATQKYTEQKQAALEDYNRASDKLDKKIRDLGDELDELADKVDADYQGLRSKYNF